MVFVWLEFRILPMLPKIVDAPLAARLFCSLEDPSDSIAS